MGGGEYAKRQGQPKGSLWAQWKSSQPKHSTQAAETLHPAPIADNPQVAMTVSSWSKDYTDNELPQQSSLDSANCGDIAECLDHSQWEDTTL